MVRKNDKNILNVVENSDTSNHSTGNRFIQFYLTSVHDTIRLMTPIKLFKQIVIIHFMWNISIVSLYFD